jgi:hypothetical protein
MPDGIDTAMDPMQTPGSGAIRDPVAVEPGGLQLVDRYHAVLICGEASDRQIALMGGNVGHIPTKPPIPPLRPRGRPL